MQHEQSAIERQNLLNEIHRLNTMLHDIETDFAECAKTGKSPCFFCANDDTCDGNNCNFVWNPNNKEK